MVHHVNQIIIGLIDGASDNDDDDNDINDDYGDGKDKMV